MIKEFQPQPFRFFQTVYPPEYMQYSIFEDLSEQEKIVFIEQETQLNKVRIKTYLEQPENGKWIDLNYNNLKYKSTKHLDFEFIERQMQYAEKLSKRDILTAASYSFKGDRIINYYKRNELDFEKFKDFFKENKYHSWNFSLFPFFPQFVDVIFSSNEKVKEKFNSNSYSYHNYRILIEHGKEVSQGTWYKVFQTFLIDFRRIIENSPVLKNEITTWRGMNTPYLYNYRKKKRTDVYKNTQFLSTTFNLNIARDFSSSERITNKNGIRLQCCYLNISIPSNSHVLLLMPYSKYLHEYEVILKDNHVFKITKNIYLKLRNELAVTNMEIINNFNEKDVQEIDLEENIEKYYHEAGFTQFGKVDTLNKDIIYLKSLK
jgi:hypothetical protein